MVCLRLQSPIDVALPILLLLLVKPLRVVLLLMPSLLVEDFLGSRCDFFARVRSIKPELEVVLAQVGASIGERIVLHAFAQGGSIGLLVLKLVVSAHPDVLLSLLRRVFLSLAPNLLLAHRGIVFQVYLV